MMMIITYLAFCFCVGLFAHHRRNRNGFGWGALSILISPLFGGIVVAILPPLEPRATQADTPQQQWDAWARNAKREKIVAVAAAVALVTAIFVRAYVTG